MKIDLSDDLKNLKVTIQLSVDSIKLGTTTPPGERTEGVFSINVNPGPNCTFDVSFVVVGTCKVWAKWFASDVDSAHLPYGPNPFATDGGTLFVDYKDGSALGSYPLTLTGHRYLVIVTWSVDQTNGGFVTNTGQGECSSSSSSSSSNSSSSLSSGSSNSSNSSLLGQSSNSAASNSSTTSASSTSSGSKSSTSSNNPPTSSSSATSASSGSSGPTPMSSTNSAAPGKSAH